MTSAAASRAGNSRLLSLSVVIGSLGGPYPGILTSEAPSSLGDVGYRCRIATGVWDVPDARNLSRRTLRLLCLFDFRIVAVPLVVVIVADLTCGDSPRDSVSSEQILLLWAGFPGFRGGPGWSWLEPLVG